MARALVKTHIRGFDDDVLRGGIPQGHVILIRGASGTMKSSLAYYVLYHNALAGVPGLYVTLEQSAGSLLEHVASLGLKATSVSEALPILDLSRGREHLEEMVARVGALTDATAGRDQALLAVLKGKILELRKKRNFELLALDSWDALELVLEFRDRRLEPVTDVAYQRRVQCVKMRSVNQDSDDRTLLFENGRFEVARAIG